MVYVGLVVLAACFGGTFFGGKYINENTHGDGAMIGGVLLLLWLLGTLGMASKLILS